MADKLSRKERSSLMGKIKSKETKLEINFRKILWGAGVRYRKNSSKHIGKPDVVVASKKIAIFIDSCFWHGCPKHCRMPAGNRGYWLKKIANNRKRDKFVDSYYRKNGWLAIRAWEHDISNKNYQQKILRKLK
jgi:DNA mismatch endonuclease (patch repair protein)